MDKQRQRFIKEMEVLKQALLKTKSQYLMNDYTKALKRMQKELNEYDTYKGYVKNKGVDI